MGRARGHPEHGKTRADALCGLKVQALAGETLPRVLEALRREAMYGY